ncbi:bifunctional [glutamine synthetase] adenylyltransferase/[glutamine synthetase]-adenylyl-L-tyrosine phosphorylase [Agilicoccus flavus]|uniref:bifunctional [glutamine synthetase] adenylyltransferase/[glutamine synthetase]-adenylyl-L-tyrosine phosphorylase n=1 Tax=Agilicoccus flavus TaxID=2775968 RepID=UPI001CF6B54A|nr:bifunctional [glutamine synthetase] adenylyltransferase/[glutamine synthetase]-adenylyl-L-tyrosine phosphorylase [Agilicoccus flavus]
MTGARRKGSAAAQFARWGFDEPARAGSLAADPALAGLADADADENGLLRAIGRTADPDVALLGLVRLLEAADGPGHLGRDAHRVDELREVLGSDGPRRARLLAVLGASAALGDHLQRHPGHWARAADAGLWDAQSRSDDLVRAVSPQVRGDRSGADALRVAYRAHLLEIAALDLSCDDPTLTLPQTSEALADLAGAALEAALSVARQEHPEEAAITRLAVIALGKCGGRELNYVSDVDVVFVAEPPGDAPEGGGGDGSGSSGAAPSRASETDEAATVAAATTLATTLMRTCSASTAEGTLWPVDPALRPEGKQGPLVRTVESHERYYRRWAKTWEFQALLKARTAAGDREVGAAYLDAIRPFIWSAVERENFVEDVQAMRRRVEDNVPSRESERQIKLGVGGLRDVEFTVQLLQLVHGRTDPSLRSGTTLVGLAALAHGGYVAREDAVELDHAYRLLRTLEHRIQLYKLRRTHLMPTDAADLRRIGRSVGYRSEPGEEVIAAWRAQKVEVRRLHQRLFYRPLLSAAAKLTADEARLTPEAARARLLALGFRDPAGALRHLEALTSGTNRTAAIQRTLLPVMLGWFADESDPDYGLLTFRKLSDSLGSTHWYLKMLRDEGRAAERLAHVLARSKYAADLLMQAPESVQILAEESGLVPRTREEVLTTMRAAVRRKDDAPAAMSAARVIRRQELFRIALADLVDAIDDDAVARALTDVTEALLEVALYIATKKVSLDRDDGVSADIALIGLGRLGGAECGYASDADVVVVHRPAAGVDERAATEFVTAVVHELRRLVGSPGPDPSMEVDLDLRPEGKAGPVSRTIEGYRAYYDRWSATWEAQALLRARGVAGDAELRREFEALVDPIRHPSRGLSAAALTEIRRLKARMESERLPRGADPKTHFKLGRGGLSDVEWTIQLLQLQHAHEVPALATTGTMSALHAAAEAKLIEPADAAVLEEAWRLASGVRNAAVLYRVRGAESLPDDVRDADGIHRILGGGAGRGWELGERYRRVARRARAVTEHLFYGHDPAAPHTDPPTGARRGGGARRGVGR